MALSIAQVTEDDYTALYGIMALAGEYMHRVLDLSHWYPFPSSDWFVQHCADRDVFAVYRDALLIGTFNLGTDPEPYYLEDMSAYWNHTDIPALYFSAFALLPSHQQQGIGTWCMTQVDHLVQQRGYEQVRFDAVNAHGKLLTFYRQCGYTACGVLELGQTAVMCFEKRFTAI